MMVQTDHKKSSWWKWGDKKLQSVNQVCQDSINLINLNFTCSTFLCYIIRSINREVGISRKVSCWDRAIFNRLKQFRCLVNVSRSRFYHPISSSFIALTYDNFTPKKEKESTNDKTRILEKTTLPSPKPYSWQIGSLSLARARASIVVSYVSRALSGLKNHLDDGLSPSDMRHFIQCQKLGSTQITFKCIR